MSKTLQTVYVPTEFKNREVLLKFLNVVDSKWAKPLQAYLYTAQEHQSAQGYRDALEKIANNPIPSNSNEVYELLTEIVKLAQAALSAAPTTQEETYGEFMRSNPPIPPTTPIKVLDEKLQIASDAWNACRDRSDYENRKAWFDFKKLPTPMTKIEYIDSLSQSLKPQP